MAVRHIRISSLHHQAVTSARRRGSRRDRSRALCRFVVVLHALCCFLLFSTVFCCSPRLPGGERRARSVGGRCQTRVRRCSSRSNWCAPSPLRNRRLLCSSRSNGVARCRRRRAKPRRPRANPRCALFCCVPRAENVVFTDNSAVKGGAVHSVAAEPCEDSRCAHVDAAAFVNVGFVGNYAKQRGGALADEVG